MDVIFKANETTPDFVEDELLSLTEENFYKEVDKGLHEYTKRPISGILNHCDIEEGSAEVKEAFDKLMEGAFAPVEHLDEAVDTSRGNNKGKEAQRQSPKEQAKGDPELEDMLATAKEMGIRNAHSMKKETLRKKIAKIKNKE
jgi:hypothetical protein